MNLYVKKSSEMAMMNAHIVLKNRIELFMYTNLNKPINQNPSHPLCNVLLQSLHVIWFRSSYKLGNNMSS
jgi:hypothetical protein